MKRIKEILTRGDRHPYTLLEGSDTRRESNENENILRDTAETTRKTYEAEKWAKEPNHEELNNEIDRRLAPFEGKEVYDRAKKEIDDQKSKLDAAKNEIYKEYTDNVDYSNDTPSPTTQRNRSRVVEQIRKSSLTEIHKKYYLAIKKTLDGLPDLNELPPHSEAG